MRPMRVLGSIAVRTAGATLIALLFWVASPQAADFDGDGVDDANDNCLEVQNIGQDDTDADDCGNLCDADYDEDGVVGYSDLFEFGPAFGHSGDEEKCHAEPIPDCTVGLVDGFYLLTHFGFVPGPSGTTAGTTACP